MQLSRLGSDQDNPRLGMHDKLALTAGATGGFALGPFPRARVGRADDGREPLLELLPKRAFGLAFDLGTDDIVPTATTVPARIPDRTTANLHATAAGALDIELIDPEYARLKIRWTNQETLAALLHPIAIDSTQGLHGFGYRGAAKIERHLPLNTGIDNHAVRGIRHQPHD